MIPNILTVLNSDNFKSIPNNIDKPEKFIELVVPTGYEHLIQTEQDSVDTYLKVVSKENTFSTELIVKKDCYHPDTNHFPKFYFTDLNNHNFILNQNQLLHLILLYRFEQFKPMARPYLNLIGKDIQELSRYLNYENINTYNNKVKFNNLHAIFYFKDIYSLAKDFEEIFYNNQIEEMQWKSLFTKTNIFPSSLGSMTSSNSIVINPDKHYRAPAYSVLKDGFTSIFPFSQNIPARLQTHLLGEALSLTNSAKSIIQQDNLIIGKELVSKDNTLKEAIVVFHPIEKDTCRFMGGELEVSSNISDEFVIINKNIEENFDECFVKAGESYYPNGKDFILGTSLLNENITLTGFKEIHVTRIKTTSINGSKKIYFNGIKKAGNARIISNTGLKGVSKTLNDLGTISLQEDLKEIINEDFINDLKLRYPKVDVNSLNDYLPNDKVKILKPDIVCGMNSTKGKSNTIVLAGACLAVKLGYYKPKAKAGFEGLLNSLDEAEINEAYEALPKYIYTDMYGNQQDVHIGLVYINYTELGNTYTKVKPQSFSFEAGRFLATDSNEYAQQLYKHIWDNYLEEDKIVALKELYEIYLASQNETYVNLHNLPVYNLTDINNIFSENDLVLSKRLEFPSDSKLLDENWNKGFFIDLSKYENAPVIRIPSAKTLKLFSGVLKNGNIIYHVNLVNVSKILQGCFKNGNGYSLHKIYSKDKNRYTSALAYHAYINTIRSTIYSGPDESQQLVQTLIKPKILGCNFKQVLESTLPDNTIVITDNKVYRRLKEQSLVGSNKTVEEHEIALLALANKVDITSKEELKALFKELNNDCPLGLAIRSPCLWRSQLIKTRVWDLITFQLYLRIYKNLDINKIIDTTRNKDILLASKDVFEKSHSDSDGDILPYFQLNYEGQQILKNYKLDSVLDEEKEWNHNYVLKELSGNKDLYVEHKYKLHYISFKDYTKFLLNSAQAKASIGKATLEIWSFSTVLEAYQEYFKANNGIYQKKDSSVAMVRISDQEANLLGHTYTRLVQERVIEGIKHVQNGSKDFEIYYLKEIVKEANVKKIRFQLINDYNLSEQMVNKLMFVIKFSEDNHNLIKGCKNFISLYNKGNSPANDEALNYWEDFISNNTYFGSLLKPLLNIKSDFIQSKSNDKMLLDNLFGDSTESDSVFELDDNVEFVIN